MGGEKRNDSAQAEEKGGQKRKREGEEEEERKKKPRRRIQAGSHQLLAFQPVGDGDYEESSDEDYVDGQSDDDLSEGEEEEVDSEDEIDEIAEAEEEEVGTVGGMVRKRNDDIERLLGMGFDRQVVEMILDLFHNDFDAALEQLISLQET